jgi:methyl-accepting chemotaxis protein
MAKFNFSAKIRIGTKLGLSLGLGVVLVAGMIVSEQINSNIIEALVAAADKQQASVNESTNTEVLMQKAQIAGRDLRMAQSAAQVDSLLVQLQQVGREADLVLSSLDALTVTADQRKRFNDLKELSTNYIAALSDIGSKRAAILSLFKKLDEAETKWTRSMNQVVNSEQFSFLSNMNATDSLIREAESAFKDARTAAWRYFVLSESSQVLRIAGAADLATQKLNFARRDVTNDVVSRGIEGLSAIVPEYIAILKSITDTIDLQNLIQTERVGPAEVAARLLLDRAVAVSTELSDRATHDATAGVAHANRVRLAVGLAVTLLLIGTAIFAALAIGKPIRRIGEVLMRLANGNTSVAIPYTDRGDEIGDTARVAGIFKDNLLRIGAIEAEQNATEQLQLAERKSAMLALADTFEATIGEIVNAVSSTSAELQTAASTLTQTADVTQELTVVVASAAEQASSNVRAVSQSTDEISASTGEISRQVHESRDIAGQAVQQAQVTDRRITALLDAASRIGDVVNLISAVAAQTNLLALNATIEAARAGEAGRGFAVVASEVKVLAQRTAEATKEITAQIAGIQTATRDSVSALQDIGSTIGRLAEIAAAIAGAVEQQHATTQEISVSVRQAANGTSQVASSILDVNNGAAKTGAASGHVLSSARLLAAESAKLRLEAGKFLQTVRAA